MLLKVQRFLFQKHSKYCKSVHKSRSYIDLENCILSSYFLPIMWDTKWHTSEVHINFVSNILLISQSLREISTEWPDWAGRFEWAASGRPRRVGGLVIKSKVAGWLQINLGMFCQHPSPQPHKRTSYWHTTVAHAAGWHTNKSFRRWSCWGPGRLMQPSGRGPLLKCWFHVMVGSENRMNIKWGKGCT